MWLRSGLMLLPIWLCLLWQTSAFPVVELGRLHSLQGGQVRGSSNESDDSLSRKTEDENQSRADNDFFVRMCKLVRNAPEADSFTRCLVEQYCDPGSGFKFDNAFSYCRTKSLSIPLPPVLSPPSADIPFQSMNSLRRREQSSPRSKSFKEKFASWNKAQRAGVVIGFIFAGILGIFVGIEIAIILGILLEYSMYFLMACAAILKDIVVWSWDKLSNVALWYRRKFAWPQFVWNHVCKPLGRGFMQLLYKEWPLIGQLKDPHPELKPFREMVDKNWQQRRSRAMEVARDDSHLENPPSPSVALRNAQQAEELRKVATNDAEIQDNRRICTICFEGRPITHFPSRKLTKQCRHEANCCLDCISNEIRRTLEISGWNEAGCVTEKCGGILQRQSIQMFAFKEDVNKLERIEQMRNLEKQKNFRWCSNPACTEGAEYPSGLCNPILTCKNLECTAKQSCFIHQGPWHLDQTCREYQQQLDGTYSEITAAEMDAKPLVYGVACPGCGVRIFRISGCANMTCSLCHRSFQYTGPTV